MVWFVILSFFAVHSLFATADERYYQIIRTALYAQETQVQKELETYCLEQIRILDSRKAQLEQTLKESSTLKHEELLAQISKATQEAAVWKSILLPLAQGAIRELFQSRKNSQAQIEKLISFIKSQVPSVSTQTHEAQETLTRAALSEMEWIERQTIMERQRFLHAHTPGADYVMAEPDAVGPPPESASELAARAGSDVLALCRKLVNDGYEQAQRLWGSRPPN